MDTDQSVGTGADLTQPSQPLHIVHVVTRLLRAGSEENTVATCRWQAAAGHRVTLIHGADHDYTWADELTSETQTQDAHTHQPGRPYGQITLLAVPEMVHRIRPLADLAAIRALRRVFDLLSPDVIHTHQSKAGILGRIAAPHTALVVHGIHILPFVGVGPLARRGYIGAERYAARRTDHFIGVSRSVAQAYVDLGIARADRTDVVQSGMDLAPFRSGTLPPDAAWLIGADPHAPDRPPVVLMLAAFEPRKRHLAFLAAFAGSTAMAGVRLILAGAGAQEGAVRTAVQTLGLTARVTLCGHRNDPAALIALADLTVLTSAREGLPRVVVQSIAAGCPVVVSRLPGIEEIVADGINGCITDPNDLSDTIRQIARLLSDRAALDGLRRGAGATDVSRWSLDSLGRRTTAIYASAMSAKSRRGHT